MTLDHSSPVTLVGDLDLHKCCVFRYDLTGGRRGPLWRLVWARTGCDDHLLICTRGTTSGIEESSEWRLRDGCLQLMPEDAGFPCLYWQVVVDGPPLRGSLSSADDSQRDQLDKNLRGVFA